MMELRDSRRLTGPNLLWDHPGAIIDVELSSKEAEPLIEAWTLQARRVLEAVGWGSQQTTHRSFPRWVSLALSAPIDALYAATEVNEWAWESARATLAGEPVPELEKEAARLRELIREEVNPPLIALRDAASRQGVAFLGDDDLVSVGMGSGSLTWEVDAIPDPADIDWKRVHDVPVAMITGTNGKTTTIRVLGRMALAAGLTPGFSSTDAIQVGREVLDRGDWSGPGGARRVAREKKVELSLLETARGGILRRGLALNRIDAALITNVAEDHLGESGIHDLRMLAETKFVVARVADKLILNADDPVLVSLADRVRQPVTWFSLDPRNPMVAHHLDQGGTACILDGDHLMVCRGSEHSPLLTVSEAPMTLNGAARHNIANALAAVGVGIALGLPFEAMVSGLRAFGGSLDDNPGRLNLLNLGGTRVLVDYAHNPHGIAAVLEMAEQLRTGRLLILLGQAGDRDETMIRELARTVWNGRPDRVVIKEMKEYLRGREPGEVPRILADELRSLGATSGSIDHGDTEFLAVQKALSWAREGDLLLLFCHAERDAVLELLSMLQSRDWKPGEPLPGLG